MSKTPEQTTPEQMVELDDIDAAQGRIGYLQSIKEKFGSFRANSLVLAAHPASSGVMIEDADKYDLIKLIEAFVDERIENERRKIKSAIVAASAKIRIKQGTNLHA